MSKTIESTIKRTWIGAGVSRVPIDLLTMEETLQAILDRPQSGWGYVVTPNLHHLDLVRRDPSMAELYEEATLSLPDGWPVAWLASRVARERVQRVAGSDLFDRLLASEGRGRPLAIIGGVPGDGMRRLVSVTGANGWRTIVEPAPREELVDEGRRTALMARVTAAADGGIVVIGVGAPRQEILARDMSRFGGEGMILCLGMSINFSTGDVHRAPVPVRTVGLEWAFRALQEPTRLGPRYLGDAMALVPLALQNKRGGA
ncbi:WecB/TagA/CpsF family glycosyltransferase [Agromyces albus]|uniref:Glycosyltransferase n=1 Tax=Agromyces albus TaxID=205332 RepID=A0A4Q2L3U2_9MICO|nr:WecB/TagA/CpsF family glycosyltransferase [Agromyces albus]RXZ72229.1 glycosyltransferase [Agromyces albus]